MTASKLYTHAGVSVPLGKTHYVFRTATSQQRIDQLVKLGDVKIDIVALVTPMSKQDAAAYLKKINFANGDQGIETALNKVTNAYYKKIYEQQRKAAKHKNKTAVEHAV